MAKLGSLFSVFVFATLLIKFGHPQNCFTYTDCETCILNKNCVFVQTWKDVFACIVRQKNYPETKRIIRTSVRCKALEDRLQWLALNQTIAITDIPSKPKKNSTPASVIPPIVPPTQTSQKELYSTDFTPTDAIEIIQSTTSTVIISTTPTKTDDNSTPKEVTEANDYKLAPPTPTQILQVTEVALTNKSTLNEHLSKVIQPEPTKPIVSQSSSSELEVLVPSTTPTFSEQLSTITVPSCECTTPSYTTALIIPKSTSSSLQKVRPTVSIPRYSPRNIVRTLNQQQLSNKIKRQACMLLYMQKIYLYQGDLGDNGVWVRYFITNPMANKPRECKKLIGRKLIRI